MNTFIEIIFSLAVFINAALFIPQVIKIVREKSAKAVSFITFGGFNLIQIAIIAHGFIHHDWLLAIGMGLSFITCGAVTILIIVYEGKARFLGMFKKNVETK